MYIKVNKLFFYTESLFMQMTDMGKLIFIADNLAYFPYQTVDEPLFLMNAIEVFVSVSGSNVIQALKEVCKFILIYIRRQSNPMFSKMCT